MESSPFKTIVQIATWKLTQNSKMHSEVWVVSFGFSLGVVKWLTPCLFLPPSGLLQFNLGHLRIYFLLMPTRNLKWHIWLTCVPHSISSEEHCSLANAKTKEIGSRNTGKGDTESLLFADNWLSDKKIIWKLSNQRENSLRYLENR